MESRRSPGPAKGRTAALAKRAALHKQRRGDDLPLADGFVDIDSLVAQDETDARKRKTLESARQKLADKLGDLSIVTFLRLKRGWSQKQLASELGTSQPHVARIEAGTEDLRLSTIIKLSSVLGVQPHEIVQGLTSKRARGA